MKIIRNGTAGRQAAEGALYYGGAIDFECLTAWPDSRDLDIYLAISRQGDEITIADKTAGA